MWLVETIIGWTCVLNDAALGACAIFLGMDAGCGIHPDEGCDDNDEFFLMAGWHGCINATTAT